MNKTRRKILHRWSYRFCRGIIAWLMIFGDQFISRLPAQAIQPEDVERTIENGIEYLRLQLIESEGRWVGYEGYQSGQTALVVLALLNCGLPPDDPTVAKGLAYLARTAPNKTYETSLQVMAFCAADPQRYAQQIRRNVDWLHKAQNKKGDDRGGWGYDMLSPGTDPSNAQFAVLALWEAQRSQITKSTEAMRMAAEYWSKLQNDTVNDIDRGGWRYDPRSMSSTGSMTCAGIASLLMAEESLEVLDANRRGDELDCCLKETRRTKSDLGLEWLERHYQINVNPKSSEFWLYYLYALERVGRLTGQRLIAGHDWYREGCELLVRRQDPLRGFITDRNDDQNRITGTALALLFLSKGKRKVVIGRLESESNTSIPPPRHAVQHLTGHIEAAWKMDLAWQSIAISGTTVEQLLEAPVLLLSGADALSLAPAEKILIKEYVEQGGFLVAEARDGEACDPKAFEASFRALMEELFETQLQKLAPEHPIWSAESQVDVSALPDQFWLYGLETCCRTSVVFSPISLSCRWEVHRPNGLAFRSLPENLQRECTTATLLGVNIVTYATGRELKEKLESIEVTRSSDFKPTVARGMIQVPRLLHTGGAEETPRALPNLMEVMRRNFSSQILTSAPLVAIRRENLEEPPIVYLSGRRTFEFTQEERESLKEFFRNGGTLIGDAVCASQEFTDTVHRELSAIAPNAVWQRVEASHPMLTTQYSGFDIRRVELLDPTAAGGNQAVGMQKRDGPPVLELLMENEVCLAIFSPLDLSCALESRQVSLCRGYSRADAAKIGSNMILYALLR